MALEAIQAKTKQYKNKQQHPKRTPDHIDPRRKTIGVCAPDGGLSPNHSPLCMQALSHPGDALGIGTYPSYGLVDRHGGEGSIFSYRPLSDRGLSLFDRRLLA